MTTGMQLVLAILILIVLVNIKWRGKLYHLNDLKEADLVKDLKSIVENRIDVDRKNLKLLYKGSVLKDDQKVIDLKLSDV